MQSEREVVANSEIKMTKKRAAVLEILNQAHLPITAEQIYLKLKEGAVIINLATVYRTLNVFIQKGMVVKLNISCSNTSTFEMNRMEHKHYITCLSCRKMIMLDGCPMEIYEKTLIRQTGFDVIGHKFEILGYCPECKEKKQNMERRRNENKN